MPRRLPYSGRYTVQLDAKRRAILPAPLRKLAEQELSEHSEPTGEFEFFLTYYAPGCLHLYTCVGFERQLELMRSNVEEIEDDEEYMEAKDALDGFLHDSVNLKLGEQGRLLIPSELYEQSGLQEGESVYVVGSDTVIEIWSTSAYEQRFGKLRSQPQRTEALMRKLTRKKREKKKKDEVPSG